MNDLFHVGEFDVLRGKCVPWASSLASVCEQEGEEDDLVSSNYMVIERNAHCALVAQMLDNRSPSSKHRYVVDRDELEEWILTHPAKEENEND